tara:strand:- start:33 stop:575 length:543 start_codon:yes stop_codon:yes gene_type:complete
MTTDTPTREEGFVNRVEGLDSGQLAMLRRGCGERDPVEGRCPWLLGIIYGVASDPVAFLVASLLAQYKTSDIHSGRHRIAGDFGQTWRRSIVGNGSESIRRRFHIVLDAEYDPQTGDGDLPYRLRQMTRYAASKGVGIDWVRLLKHLRSWNASERWVQKEWARSFFEPNKSIENENNEGE